jgi:hypothetical protein
MGLEALMGYDNSRLIEEPDDLYRETDDESIMEYRERVMNDLQTAVTSFLEFSTASELIKLIAECL